MHILPVGGHHGEQHGHDGQPHPGRQDDGGDARQRQGQQDFVRRIGHGGQCIRGEDRQGNALGQQGVGQPLAPVGPADEHPLERIEQFEHEPKLV